MWGPQIRIPQSIKPLKRWIYFFSYPWRRAVVNVNLTTEQKPLFNSIISRVMASTSIYKYIFLTVRTILGVNKNRRAQTSTALPRELGPLGTVMSFVRCDCLPAVNVLGCSVNWLYERLMLAICPPRHLLSASKIHKLRLASRDKHISCERIHSTVSHTQIHSQLINTRPYFLRRCRISPPVDNAFSSEQLLVACDSISSDLKWILMSRMYYVINGLHCQPSSPPSLVCL